VVRQVFLLFGEKIAELLIRILGSICDHCIICSNPHLGWLNIGFDDQMFLGEGLKAAGSGTAIAVGKKFLLAWRSISFFEGALACGYGPTIIT
jgi:hypothetical protein